MACGREQRLFRVVSAATAEAVEVEEQGGRVSSGEECRPAGQVAGCVARGEGEARQRADQKSPRAVSRPGEGHWEQREK